MVAAVAEEWAGGEGVQRVKGKENRCWRREKEKGGSQPERARGAFEVHAKRSLRGCFSDFSGKSAATDYEFAPENVAEILEKLTSEEGKR